MKKRIPVWLIGLLITLAVVAVPVAIFLPKAAPVRDNPQAGLLPTPIHVSHVDIVQGPLDTPQQVTRACLTCHPDAAAQLMGTTHWTWESKPFDVPWRDAAGDHRQDQPDQQLLHRRPGQPEELHDLPRRLRLGRGRLPTTSRSRRTSTAWSATPIWRPTPRASTGIRQRASTCWPRPNSVRMPTRENCGKCHFDGGGGNGVKHGDLDESLIYPVRRARCAHGRARLSVHRLPHDRRSPDPGPAGRRQLYRRSR